MKTIAFLTNKSGAGTTSLVYHLAWMYADRGIKVLVADLDPQASLSAMFLDDERLAQLWVDGKKGAIVDSLQALIDRAGEIAEPHVEGAAQNIGLLAGSPALSRFEDILSNNWRKCLDGDVPASRIVTAFHCILGRAANNSKADLVLIDPGPYLGAITRAALIAAQQVVVPLAPDLFSLQGLRNLGPTLREWRKEWEKRVAELPDNSGLDAPAAVMQPAGYAVMQHGVLDSRTGKAYGSWTDRIPGVYRNSVLNMPDDQSPTVERDPFCLSLLKHYRSLMPLAMDAHKPMFFLKPADGAIGAHAEAVRACYDDFLALGKRIGEKSGFAVS